MPAIKELIQVYFFHYVNLVPKFWAEIIYLLFLFFIINLFDLDFKKKQELKFGFSCVFWFFSLILRKTKLPKMKDYFCWFSLFLLLDFFLFFSQFNLRFLNYVDLQIDELFRTTNIRFLSFIFCRFSFS